MELLRPLADSEYPATALSISTSAASTATWQPGAQGVVVWADAACYVSVGPDAAATTSSTPIPANVPIPFYVSQQTSSRPWRVSAKTITGTGTLYCKPINIR